MIEVGEYIRTNKGDIFEFQRIMESYNGDFYMWGTDYKGCYEKDVKAHSKNIIDLIEVGDYVNGVEVVEIANDKFIDEKLLKNEDIKTIVTKEQFNSVMYKVGDIE